MVQILNTVASKDLDKIRQIARNANVNRTGDTKRIRNADYAEYLLEQAKGKRLRGNVLDNGAVVRKELILTCVVPRNHWRMAGLQDPTDDWVYFLDPYYVLTAFELIED